MLPTDVIKLIEDYNKHNYGCFFWYQGNIYWFGRNRYEYWCISPIFYDLERLDYIDGYLQTPGWIYKSNKWENKKWNTRMLISMQDNTQLFERLIPTKSFPKYGIHCKFYEHVLYVFSAVFNEKYDLQTKKWSHFTNRSIKNDSQLYLANGLFYIIDAQKIQTYNPILDFWQESDLHDIKIKLK